MTPAESGDACAPVSSPSSCGRGRGRPEPCLQRGRVHLALPSFSYQPPLAEPVKGPLCGLARRLAVARRRSVASAQGDGVRGIRASLKGVDGVADAVLLNDAEQLAVRDKRVVVVESALALVFAGVHKSSRSKLFVGDAAASGRCDQVVQPLEVMALHVAFVQAEGELVHVPTKVLLAGMVVHAMQAALQDRPDAFDAVGVYAVPDVLSRAVVDRGALEEQPAEALIGRVLVAVDHAPRLDVLVDRAVQRGDIHVPDMQGDGAPSTFTHPEDGGFSHSTPAALQALGLVLGRFLAADVRLVHFHDAAQHLQVRAARLGDSAY